MVPADSDRAPPTPPYSGSPHEFGAFLYGSITLYAQPFQIRSSQHPLRLLRVLLPQLSRNLVGLGSSPFARHYSGNHSCFLLLRVLRCFSSPRSPPLGYLAFNQVGSPIRISTDHLLLRIPVAFRS